MLEGGKESYKMRKERVSSIQVYYELTERLVQPLVNVDESCSLCCRAEECSNKWWRVLEKVL